MPFPGQLRVVHDNRPFTTERSSPGVASSSASGSPPRTASITSGGVLGVEVPDLGQQRPGLADRQLPVI